MATLPIHDDYLFVGPLIQQRLRDQLPELPVEGIEEMALAGDQDRRQRVVYVMWGGERFSDPGGRGTAVGLQQTWLVLLNVRHVASAARDKDARNTTAGPLISALRLALAGHQLPGTHRPLSCVPGPRPSYTKESALYALAFELPLGL
jgi:hypothetical protein